LNRSVAVAVPAITLPSVGIRKLESPYLRPRRTIVYLRGLIRPTTRPMRAGTGVIDRRFRGGGQTIL